jgi:hypothetical protein
VQHRTAAGRDAAEVRPPACWIVPPLSPTAIVVAVVTGSVAQAYGGPRVLVVDRATDDVVGDVREALLVDGSGPVGRMLGDHERMSAEELARACLDSGADRVRPTPARA